MRHYGAAMLAKVAADWGSVRAAIIRRERIGQAVQCFRLPSHVFRLGISGFFQPGSTTRVGALRAAPLTTNPGCATFYPAGVAITNDVVGASRLTYMTVEIDLASPPDAEGGVDDVTPVIDVRDPVCLALLQRLRREVEEPTTAQRLFAETAALLLILSVNRPSCAPRSARKGGFGTGKLARLTDYISDHHAEESALADLAQLAGVSRTHLCRAFKASTGTTPHRWQLLARIDRAKSLMGQRELSLADIAIATGFSDQSHFSNAFRRATGVTPSFWRKNTVY